MDKLNPKTSNSNSYLSFKNAVMKFVRPSESKIFNSHDQVGIKLVTKLLQLHFSRIFEDIFRHNLTIMKTLN